MITKVQIVCLITFVLLVAACGPEQNSETYVGYVEGEYVYVAAPRSGWIVSVPVAEGSGIQTGDVLFELDDDLERINVDEASAREAQSRAQARNIQTGARPAEIAKLRATLSEAEAGLTYAESEYTRVSSLVKDEILPPADGDRALLDRNRAKARVEGAKEAIRVAELTGREAELDAASASVESAASALMRAEWNLDQRTVTSRVDARVESIIQRPGEFVNAGSPVLSLLPVNALKVRFFLPAEKVSQLSTGSSVQIAVPGIEDDVEGIVSFVASEAEFTPPVIYSVDAREKLVFLVEARLLNETQVRPGVPVDVQLQ